MKVTHLNQFSEKSQNLVNIIETENILLTVFM
jgi:hypothetical protein